MFLLTDELCVRELKFIGICYGGFIVNLKQKTSIWLAQLIHLQPQIDMLANGVQLNVRACVRGQIRSFYEETKLVSKIMLKAYSQLKGVKVRTMCWWTCKLQADEIQTDSSD